MLVFIVIIAIAAVVAYFVVSSKKKTVQHVEDIKVQSTVLPKEESKKVEPIAEVQVAEPEQLEERKKAVAKKKATKKAK